MDGEAVASKGAVVPKRAAEVASALNAELECANWLVVVELLWPFH